LKYSIAVPGTFHAFDVANELSILNKLETIYSFSDFLRILKWKKKVPFSNIYFFKLPLIKRGRMTRIDGDKKFSKLIKNDNSDVIIGFPNISKEIFQNNKTKIKVLDIDHFNWDKDVLEVLKNEKYSHFNKIPVDPKKTIMQKNELADEYKIRNIDFSLDINIFKNEPIECELADVVMVPVSYVKETLVKAGYPEDKILVNPYGYDDSIFYPSKNKKFKKTILYGGTISIRKGWFYLKDILNHFNGSNINFIVAGGIESTIKADVETFFKESESNITYIGSVSQKKLAYYMRNVNLFLFPSVLEGFGMTVLQSMASGTPVITSKATCGVDLITNGNNGYVFDKKDINSWTSQIESIIDDKNTLDTMGVNAFNIAKNITWSNYVDNLDRFIKRCIVNA
jgi:glycosyltransferase involved in cell wall biosynthesis